MRKVSSLQALHDKNVMLLFENEIYEKCLILDICFIDVCQGLNNKSELQDDFRLKSYWRLKFVAIPQFARLNLITVFFEL